MFSTRLSLVAICFLQLLLTAPASSLNIRDTSDTTEYARELDINADDIFPSHQAEKRGLLGALGDVVSGVGGLVNTLLGGPATTSTTSAAPAPAPAATTSSANNNNNNNNNGGNTPAATTSTANGSGNNGSSNDGSGSDNTSANDSPAPTTAANNQGGNNVVNTGNQANTGAPTAAASGPASASAGIITINAGSVSAFNALFTGTGWSLITDQYGNTVVATGPVTFEYLTTLPDGVVSTVTEVITPSAAAHSSPPNPHAQASKIAAVVGSIVALFLVIFTVALLLLLARKRRRASQLANSRRDSTTSFGSADRLHDSPHDSAAPLAPVDSMTSFRTAPTYIDGEKMEFPLPPVPSAGSNQAETGSSSQRPVSMGSDGTFDLVEHRSRTSLIADRNFYRKIGQYPAAGTYTPFALPPSSDLGHSEEAFGAGRFSPTELSAALQQTSNFHGNYKRGTNVDEPPSVSENPFRDSVNFTHPASPAPVVTVSQNILRSPSARQSTLWRKATFGSSHLPSNRQEAHPPSSFTEPHVGTFGRKASLNSDRGTVRSQEISEYETATETQSQHTSGSGRYSYHSAFGRYAGDQGDENPFSDPNQSESRPPSSRLLASPIGWRPTTANSAKSSRSNVDREPGSTPDPKEPAYNRPSTGQSLRPDSASSQASSTLMAPSPRLDRMSQDSRSDGEKTIRQSTIAYPSLGGVIQRLQARV